MKPRKWSKRRIERLLLTIENARMNAAHASTIALEIWEEWESLKGLTQDESDSLVDCLTDAKIQIDMALEELEERGRK